MIQYITGDATCPTGEGVKVIAHVCNDMGGWGRGFVLALSQQWNEPEKSYRDWAAGRTDRPFGLGQTQYVTVDHNLWVANMIGQHKTHTIAGVPPVRYEAMETALGDVADFAISKTASVHLPRIGCGLAGGKWEIVEQIVNRSLCKCGVEVIVYDLPVK